MGGYIRQAGTESKYVREAQREKRYSKTPAGEEECAGHALHALAAVAATASEKVPERQSVQAADPGTVLYLPATHAVQSSLPSGPV